MAAAVFATEGAVPRTATLGDACPGSVYEDIMDIVLMATVFAVGFFLFKWLAIDLGANTFLRRAIAPSKLADDDIVKPSAPAAGKRIRSDFEQVPFCDSQRPADPQQESAIFLDQQLIQLACAGDLSACWHLLRCQADQRSTSANDALVTALHCATNPADADSALCAAVAFGSEGLADAAVAAGARLCGAAWLRDACARLEEAGLPRKASRAVEMARAHGRQGRGDLAVDEWCTRCCADGLEAGSGESLAEPELYSAALEACAASQDFASAARMVRAAGWLAPPDRAGQGAMLALVRWLLQCQGVAPARRCVEAVQKAGGQVDAATLRAMLSSGARSGNMVQAKRFFDDLVGTGFTPSYKEYSSLVRGYCVAGDIQEALAHFRAMRERGIAPEISLFDAILGACVSRNMLRVAEEVLADMEDAGVRPTNATLATFVRLHGARGQVARALEVFAEFPSKYGLEPDSHAYHALVTVCLACGRPELALDAFAKMTSSGGLASARTYEALIAGCSRRGELAGAAALVEDALGLTARGDALAEGDGAAAQQQPPPQRRAHVEPRVVEELLRLVGRRGEAARLGLPLIAKLEEAGFEVSERVVLGVQRAAEAQATSLGADSEVPASEQHSSLQARRAVRSSEWARWRNGFAR